jgi:hypothetical protein
MLARTAFFDFDMFRIREFLLGVCITFALWIPSMNEKLFSNNTQIQFHSLVALGNQYADTDNHCVEMANTRHRISLSSLADRTDFLRMVVNKITVFAILICITLSLIRHPGNAIFLMIIIAAEISWMNHFIGIQVLESESSLTHRLYASRIECLHGDAKLEKVLKT